jgi:hypothetical protein
MINDYADTTYTVPEGLWNIQLHFVSQDSFFRLTCTNTDKYYIYSDKHVQINIQGPTDIIIENLHTLQTSLKCTLSNGLQVCRGECIVNSIRYKKLSI